MWFGLHGLQLLGFILLGTVTVVGVVALAVGYLVKWLGETITDTFGHKQATCDCIDCRRRRKIAVEKFRASNPEPYVRKPIGRPEESPAFISTTMLEPGLVVVLGNATYRVDNIRTDAKGYLIELVNNKTRDRFVRSIHFVYADRRIWVPLHRFRRDS